MFQHPWLNLRKPACDISVKGHRAPEASAAGSTVGGFS